MQIKISDGVSVGDKARMTQPMHPAHLELHLNKMSVAQLEQFVSCIVRTSCGNGEVSERVASKSKRWSRDVGLRYPLTRARTTDSTKWRETLLNVVARCTNRGKDRALPNSSLSTRRRLKSTDIESKQREENQNDNAVRQTILQEKYSLSERSPVVRLCDVMKLQDKKYDSTTKKSDFLNYFKLSDTQNCSVIVNNNVCRRYQHPFHLLNSQNIPFSSDLGRKLTKECHIVSEDIHQRKIERVERYLTTTINPDTAKSVQYEVCFNKQPQYSHTYVFPNKIYRRQGRISSKATLLLINYCKPCTVRLEKLPTQNNLDNNLVAEEIIANTHNQNLLDQSITSNQQLFNTVSKENLPSPVDTQSKDISMREREVETTMPKIKNSILTQNNHQHYHKTSIILSPIKDLLSLHTPSSDGAIPKNNTVERKIKALQKINRVEKKRVIIYETRRFSFESRRVLRLRCIRNK